MQEVSPSANRAAPVTSPGAVPADVAVQSPELGVFSSQPGVTPPEVGAPGSIGGEPILPKPIVLGAISTGAVDAALSAKRPAIDACFADGRKHRPTLRGKVLVKFKIEESGRVAEATIESTSLRDDVTEACVLSLLGETTFPPLLDGKMAIVRYPFEFPALR